MIGADVTAGHSMDLSRQIPLPENVKVRATRTCPTLGVTSILPRNSFSVHLKTLTEKVKIFSCNSDEIIEYARWLYTARRLKTDMVQKPDSRTLLRSPPVYSRSISMNWLLYSALSHNLKVWSRWLNILRSFYYVFTFISGQLSLLFSLFSDNVRACFFFFFVTQTR